MVRKFILWTFLLTSLLVLQAEEKNYYIQPVFSHDGQNIALTKEGYEGVYLWDKQASKFYLVTEQGSGYKINWSFDNKKFAFKMFNSEKEQAPALFDLQEKKLVLLSSFGRKCGVPCFSENGKISFSLDKTICVLEKDGALLKKIAIDTYANLCVISPDGKWIAYNDKDDQIWIVSTVNSEKQKLTSDEHAYFNPVWSYDSQKLLVSTVSGTLKVFVPSSSESYTLDVGENPIWMPDNQSILYAKRVIQGEKLVNMDMYHVDYRTSNPRAITASSDIFESSFAYNASNSNFLVCDEKSKSIFSANLVRGSDTVDIENFQKMEIPALASLSVLQDFSSMPVYESSTTSERGKKVINGVPYVHQVYDTPDWYNGHSACGATSASMALAYYNLIQHWDCTVSVPYSHVSHYGRYVCEKYTYNGYTFNKMTPDPNGKAAYGGYGYICQNDWEDTKGHMAEYFQKHGVNSSVDWSPTWSEVITQIDNGHPFVILNSLTSAGHYVLGIGYYTDQHTVVVNDPYGNKNTPGYPSYDGAGSCYDWPGYNNGYKNLNTVHCFIYAKK